MATAVRLRAPAAEVEPLSGGGFLVRSPVPLGDVPSSLGQVLRAWRSSAGDRAFLAERDGPGWRAVTYAEAFESIEGIGAGLLRLGASPQRPVMLLSDNSIAHGLLQLGAMDVGVPVVPVSAAYSLRSRTFEQLRAAVALVDPWLVFAEDGDVYGNALQATEVPAERWIVARNGPAQACRLEDVGADRGGNVADNARSAVGPDTIAKILLTSGSTSSPKGVINTQRMLCSNQVAIANLWLFLRHRPPVLLDWLPWSHTFGGNHNFNLVLFNGGTLYIDDGKPTAEAFQRSLENLLMVSATIDFNVPRGFDALLPRLERDPELRTAYFGELDLLFCAGAALSQPSWDRLARLARTVGRKSPIISCGWGTTETAPMATTVHFPVESAGVIGLPGPGTEIELVPTLDRYELRVRGPNVTPGYWRRADLTALAFDDDGFFRTGDAGWFVDPDRPDKGLRFRGRIGENFKLASGTWVHVGEVRLSVLESASPLIEDVVVAAPDRPILAAIAFLNIAECRALFPGLVHTEPAELVCRREVHDWLRLALHRHNRHQGGSRRIERMLLTVRPPSIDDGEITDKGYVNQRRVLDRRAADVDRLYRGDGPDVLALD